MVYEVKNEAELKKILDDSKYVLMDFYAKWCGPCKMIVPILESLVKKFPELKVIKVDIDDLLEVASSYEVQVVPTLVLLKDGKVVEKHVGSQTEAFFEDMINKHMEK